MDAITANGPEDEPLDWDPIDCGQAEDDVRRQRIVTARRTGDLRRARELQKLMLRSRANALVSVRRVAEVNAGRKTAYGADGIAEGRSGRLGAAPLKLVDAQGRQAGVCAQAGRAPAARDPRDPRPRIPSRGR